MSHNKLGPPVEVKAADILIQAGEKRPGWVPENAKVPWKFYTSGVLNMVGATLSLPVGNIELYKIGPSKFTMVYTHSATVKPRKKWIFKTYAEAEKQALKALEHYMPDWKKRIPKGQSDTPDWFKDPELPMAAQRRKRMSIPKKVRFNGAVYVLAEHERCPDGSHWNEKQKKCVKLTPEELKMSTDAHASSHAPDRTRALKGNIKAHQTARILHERAAKHYQNLGFTDLAKTHTDKAKFHKEKTDDGIHFYRKMQGI